MFIIGLLLVIWGLVIGSWLIAIIGVVIMVMMGDQP